MELAARRQLPPTKLIAAVRGDLDWIALKALEKDRTRRYPTANALALDVRRHLADEPVSAGPPSTRYKVGKFVRRHVVGVVTATAAVVALLIVTGALLFQARRLAVERDRANQEAATSAQVTQFLISLFNVSDPGEARGNSLTAREVLDKGATQLETTLRDQPSVRTRLGTAIGTVYTNLGLYSAARALLERAVDVARASAGNNHPDTIAATNALAAVYWYQQDFAQAIELYQRVFDARRMTLGTSHKATLRAKFDLSSAYQGAMRLGEAEALLRETLDQQRATLGADDPDTIESLNNLQALYFRMKRYQDALPIAREVLERQTRKFGADHPLVLLGAHNLGAIYLELKQFDAAESLLKQALDGRRKVLGRHHERTLTTWERYARLLDDRGEIEASRTTYEGLLAEVGDDTQPPYPVLKRRTLERLVQLANEGGRPAEASTWQRQLDALPDPASARK
jgi:tetratricopeptide (TPR) repeat protein